MDCIFEVFGRGALLCLATKQRVVITMRDGNLLIWRFPLDPIGEHIMTLDSVGEGDSLQLRVTSSLEVKWFFPRKKGGMLA